MIHGPIGFRANKWVERKGRISLVSASMSGFAWPEAVVWSECHAGCPTDEEGHTMIRENCPCGIYSSVSPAVVAEYLSDTNHVVFMIEGLGAGFDDGGNFLGDYIYLHEDEYSPDGKFWCAGMTSPGAQIVAVVNLSNGLRKIQKGERKLGRQQLAILAAARFYDVPVLPLNTCLDLAKHQWERHNMKWRGICVD